MFFLNVIFACLQHQDVESFMLDLSGIVDSAVNAASTIGISHSEVHLLEYFVIVHFICIVSGHARCLTI